jgi:hypothetical protein
MAEGVEFAEADIDGEAAEPGRIVVGSIGNERATAAELIENALIGAGSYATLPMRRLESSCDEKCGEKHNEHTNRDKPVRRHGHSPDPEIRTQPSKNLWDLNK